MYAQMVYKDQKILEMDQKILDMEKNVLDLQETIQEKNEVIQGRDQAIRVTMTTNTSRSQILKILQHSSCFLVFYQLKYVSFPLAVTLIHE